MTIEDLEKIIMDWVCDQPMVPDEADQEVYRYLFNSGGPFARRRYALEKLSMGIPDKKHDPVVYYMASGNLVKIGTTTNIHRRMKAVGAERLLTTEPGGFDVERERHLQFGDLRNHNEWFRHEGALARWIVHLVEATS